LDVKTRALGRTGYNVSEIGFGGWGLGADMWLGADDREGRTALRTALELGVNFFDTALAYGTGHSEKIIGEELKGTDAIVATKIPPLNREWPADGNKSIADVFPPKYIAKCTNQSLRNLGVEALHVQQLHVWHDNWLNAWDESLAEIVKLKEQGKVLHWGISVNDHAPETALRALEHPIFETAQVIYNIYDRSPEKALFALAQRKPLGIIVRVPFDEGALTGKITASTTFPAGDWREEYFAGDRKAEVERRAKALSQVLDEQVVTLPELALRFCLSTPEVSTVIPGMRRPDHARQNVAAAAKGSLPPPTIAKLKSHAWEKNWYPP
jgi:aryl-alcohol dehydrogenase-like predicted oxidoreductase